MIQDYDQFNIFNMFHLNPCRFKNTTQIGKSYIYIYTFMFTVNTLDQSYTEALNETMLKVNKVLKTGLFSKLFKWDHFVQKMTFWNSLWGFDCILIFGIEVRCLHVLFGYSFDTRSHIQKN